MPESISSGHFYTKPKNQFPSTATWLIADITAPATVRYPAIEIKTEGIEGAARIALPIAARDKPTVLNTLNILGVGAQIRLIRDNFSFAIFQTFKNERFNVMKPFFKEFDFLVH
jgi:hypothetical protein